MLFLINAQNKAQETFYYYRIGISVFNTYYKSLLVHPENVRADIRLTQEYRIHAFEVLNVLKNKLPATF